MLKVANKMGLKDFNWVSATGKSSPAYGYKFFQTFSRFTILCYEVGAYVFNWIKREI